MPPKTTKPTVATALELSLRPEDFQPRVTLTSQYVSTVQGDCEFITGEPPAEMADGTAENADLLAEDEDEASEAAKEE